MVQFKLAAAVQEAKEKPDQIPSCVTKIDVPSEMCGIAAVHKHTDGTYFLLASDGYWMYSQDKETGEEDLAGTVSYTEIANLPVTPQRYMGFQPSL